MSIFSQHFSPSDRLPKGTRGFTLIELLVVIGIVVIISSLILFNTQGFNSAILLRSLAYEVGLSFREAQLYGVAVRETAPGTNNFGAAYGVYFPASIIGVDNANYPLFEDLNDNGIFDDGASSVLENFTIQNGFTLKNLCAAQGSSLTCAQACPSPLPTGITACTGTPLQWLAVTFKRPDPDAIIRTDVSSNPYSEAYVIVQSQNGTTREVTVSETGQIVIGD